MVSDLEMNLNSALFSTTSDYQDLRRLVVESYFQHKLEAVMSTDVLQAIFSNLQLWRKFGVSEEFYSSYLDSLLIRHHHAISEVNVSLDLKKCSSPTRSSLNQQLPFTLNSQAHRLLLSVEVSTFFSSQEVESLVVDGLEAIKPICMPIVAGNFWSLAIKKIKSNDEPYVLGMNKKLCEGIRLM